MSTLLELFVEREETTATSPEQLAQRCQAGCLRSYEELVTRFHEQLIGYLRQMMGGSHDAEDVAQESFIKAWQHIEKFNPTMSFGGWLFTIARRTAISHFRKHSRMQPLSDEILANLPGEQPQETEGLERAELWDVARTLKPKHFELLWLRYGEGFDIAEVARITGATTIGVKVALHRARGLLEQKLRHRGIGI